MEHTCDVFIIGGGTGGYTAAIRAAQEGFLVCLAEEREVGGTCLNRGCIPTKTLMHSSSLFDEISHAAEFGIEHGGARVNLSRIFERKNEVVAQIREGVEALLKTNKVQVLNAHATIIDAGQISVEGEIYNAKHIIIASGAEPIRLPIPGGALSGVVTSDEILSWEKALPKSMTIIGGGVIGVEIASIFNTFGCKVSIVEAALRILPTMDKEISQNLAMILKKRGISISTGATVSRIEAADELNTVFTGKDGESALSSEIVLVAVGRRSNLTDLFAEGFTLEQNRGIVVDKNFQTSVPGIYAIGDAVSGGIQLAHAAAAQATNLISHISGKMSETNLAVIPAGIYTNPEIASVGITEGQAKELEIDIETGKYPMSGNGKSIIENQERGFIKLVFERETKVVLGAQLMCARATDLISELTTAVVNRLTIHDLLRVVRPHPTFTEGVSEAVESVLGTAVHMSPQKKVRST